MQKINKIGLGIVITLVSVFVVSGIVISAAENHNPVYMNGVQSNAFLEAHWLPYAVPQNSTVGSPITGYNSAINITNPIFKGNGFYWMIGGLFHQATVKSLLSDVEWMNIGLRKPNSIVIFGNSTFKIFLGGTTFETTNGTVVMTFGLPYNGQILQYVILCNLNAINITRAVANGFIVNHV
jgi:hypothetical protein